MSKIQIDLLNKTVYPVLLVQVNGAGMKRNVIEVLEERGFIESVTSQDLKEKANEKLNLYIGFDPTAESLHVGNLVGILALGWFQKFGHQVFALVGGATGLIGDPTGKSLERPYLSSEKLEHNLKGIQKDLEKIIAFEPDNPVTIVNNADWYSKMGALEFLREVAAFYRVGPLLSRDTVKERLKTQEGMSVKEFCYPLIQGYDFLQLFDKYQISLELGGADQWTNITSGIELVRKKRQKEVYGLTFPLLVKSDGKKFGKSEQGAVWLSKEKLSPYEFYQYFVRSADEDVINLLKKLTFMEMSEINRLEQSMKKSEYQPNTIQKILAKEVTTIVHGSEELKVALTVTEGMKPGSQTNLNLNLLKNLANEVPSITLPKDQLLGQSLVELLSQAKVLASKGEVRRMIQNGGVYLNNERVNDDKKTISESDLIDGECLLFAIGKKKKVLFFLEK
ncbi:MAG: Tyrosine--tRNA ligase 1 [Chlamydiae bacterium]|nr:Tyrosine--tRNA ligase 1 [Chlamydiota bacterium]